jgi:formyltetrahydrofolate deformylase
LCFNALQQIQHQRCETVGATAYFVNNDLDEGPIIAQNIKEVDHRYTASDMAREGKDVEKAVLSQAIKLVFSDRVFIHGNRTVIL